MRTSLIECYSSGWANGCKFLSCTLTMSPHLHENTVTCVWPSDSSLKTIRRDFSRMPTTNFPTVRSEQECIPVGCVPPTCQSYMWWLPLDVSSTPPPWTYPPPRRAWDQRYAPAERTWDQGYPPTLLWTKWLTDECENITFQQLLLRA